MPDTGFRTTFLAFPTERLLWIAVSSSLEQKPTGMTAESWRVFGLYASSIGFLPIPASYELLVSKLPVFPNLLAAWQMLKWSKLAALRRILQCLSEL